MITRSLFEWRCASCGYDGSFDKINRKRTETDPDNLLFCPNRGADKPVTQQCP